jgi:DNA-binding PadR family transcriptional regulator
MVSRGGLATRLPALCALPVQADLLIGRRFANLPHIAWGIQGRHANIAIDNITRVDIFWDMDKPEDLLPLPPATFHILMAVADEDRHGYAIIQDVAARTGGELKLSAGTLYRSVQRMLEQGLLVETQERPAPELDDERRRYYRITPFGVAAARAEVTRLNQLVKLARACGFAPGRA